MVTQKIRCIWRIIRSQNILLLSGSVGGKLQPIGFGKGELSDIMLMAVAIKTVYNDYINMIEAGVVETGEVQAYQEMKKTIEKLEQQHGRQ